MRAARLWISIALLVTGRVALAQPGAAARTLFEEGKKLVEKGDYAAACPKFAASASLDPKPGTKLALGACYEKIGRTASAWAEFTEAAAVLARSVAVDDERYVYAHEHAQALQAKLVRLTIFATEPVPGLLVRRDGNLVSQAELGVALPVDPGEHVISASAEGHEAWSRTVRVGAEPSTSVIVPRLTKIGVAVIPRPGPEIVPRGPEEPRRSNTMKIAGYTVGGAGVVAVGVGLFFGAQASSKWSDAKAECDTATSPMQCSAAGADLRDQAASAATISTVTTIAGGVAIAAGVTMVILGSRHAPAERPRALRLVPGAGPTAAGLTLEGGF